MMIPKTIHYCWFGPAPKPVSVLKCIESWKKYCPDYEIREWTEKDFDFAESNYARQAYEEKAWGFVPDYIRLWIVYHHGGIYLDTDVQIIKSFDQMLNHKAFCGFEKPFSGDSEYYVNFGQGFGAEKFNPVIKKHMDMYDQLNFKNEDGTLNKTASPTYTTQILVEQGLVRTKSTIQELADITVYPDDYFCPKSFVSGIVEVTKNTYSIHHFDASWFSDEAKEKIRNRWKRQKREYIMDYMIHIPNRLLRSMLGFENYEKLKRRIKKG